MSKEFEEPEDSVRKGAAGDRALEPTTVSRGDAPGEMSPESPSTGADTDDAQPDERWSLGRFQPLALVSRRRAKRGLVAVFFLSLLTIGLVTQSERGQDFALRAALSRVQSSLLGKLTIQGVRSGTLLTGATITGVRLDAEDGRRFLFADSVVVRYSILAALAGEPPIRSTIFWGLDLEISRYASDQSINLNHLLVEGDRVDGSEVGEPPNRVSLGHVGFRESRVHILTPTTKRSGPRLIQGPEGGLLRELSFNSLDIDVEDAVLSISDEPQFTARLASFSSEIGVLEEPFVIDEAHGLVSYGDRGIEISEGRYRMPGGLIQGNLTVGPRTEGEQWIFSADIESDGWTLLSDIGWIDSRIPDGRFRGAAELRIENGVHLVVRDVETELEAGSVLFNGGVSFDEGVELNGMQITANPLPLELLEPWIARDLPLDGWLSGETSFNGSLTDLTVNGRVTLVPTGLGGTLTSAEFQGALHTGDNPGATDFLVSLGSMNYDVLSALWPEFPWAGSGSGQVRVHGRVDDGVMVVGDMEHLSASSLQTVAEVNGMFWRGTESGSWITDMSVDFQPLAVGVLSGIAPDLQLKGDARGSIVLSGALNDVVINADLNVGDGHIQGRGYTDLRNPTAQYRVELEADELPLFSLSGQVPDETTWSGSLNLEGSEATPDLMSLDLTGSAYASRLGALGVDALSTEMRVRNGVLIADSLKANVGGVELIGSGRLGLVENRFGSVSVDFRADQLVGLRAALMGVADSILVQEELTPLDREFLRLQGIEPDTFPRLADVRLDGAVHGAANVSGRLGDIDAGIVMQFEDAFWKRNHVDSARIALTATGLPDAEGVWEMAATAYGLEVNGRRFQKAGFEADMFERDGEARLEVMRRPSEQYHASGAFVVDSLSGSIDVDEFNIQVDESEWSLVRPAHVEWDEHMISADSIEIARFGVEPMNLVADGTVSREGESDFRLGVSGLQVEKMLNLSQIEEHEVAGHIDLDLSLMGSMESPRIDGVFQIEGPQFGAVQLTRIDGDVTYRTRELRFDLDGFDGEREALRASGTLPVDLTLMAADERVIDSPMRVEVVADSLDAAIALSYVTSLEGVVGVVSGGVSIGGVPSAPAPEGRVTLSDAAWSIEAIGVRHTGVNGTITLREGRTAEVVLSAQGNGRSDVTGTVLLEPFSDPELNLQFGFDRFLAVSRADVESSVSGNFDLTGKYSRPLAEGALTVDEGTIFVDELQRAADIVDLTDPFLFESGLAVDTTTLISQPLFAGLRNPFFDNLRVDIDLSVPRNSWLRSIDSDIEMSGDLLVRYDRRAGDFVLIGELEAVRGSHRVLGRTFELDGGSVLFLGRPGLNPDLNIEASSRIRRQNEPPLNVSALVEGTLVQPAVTLSTGEAGIAEEDLVSYLVFGQPSGASRQLGGLGRRGVVSSAVQGTVTFVGGVLTNQFGSAVFGNFLDYFSVQQSGGQSFGREYFAQTQVEVGKYVGDNLFTVVVLRPTDNSAQNQNTVAGVRVEWALTDDYNVEGFLEDRFLRSGSLSLGSTAGLIENDRIWGVLFFREWGYGQKRNSTEQN